MYSVAFEGNCTFVYQSAFSHMSVKLFSSRTIKIEWLKNLPFGLKRDTVHFTHKMNLCDLCDRCYKQLLLP